MVDFKTTAKEIFDMCHSIVKSDGRATEKIEEVLKHVYEDNKTDGMKTVLDCFKCKTIYNRGE